jgi:predicted DNA-binding transcriptional regulator YafY
MRADRLLSLMMLLQSRGKLRAEELASELEVSVRTIYRDIDALSASGVPVYADGGPGGGYSLLEGYRTELTGLSPEETEALLTLSVPGPLADLSISKKLKTAVLKVVSAAPADLAQSEERMRQRLYLDPASWFTPGDEPRFLDELQKCAWHDQKVWMEYSDKKSAKSGREVSPYALVAKAGVWYLVADTEKGMRVFRVSRIHSIKQLDAHFERAGDFNLRDFWETWSGKFIESLHGYHSSLSVAPEGEVVVGGLWPGTGESLRNAPVEGGWKKIEVTFANEHEALWQILQMGTLVRVESPPALRDAVRDAALGIAGLYRGGKGNHE